MADLPEVGLTAVIEDLPEFKKGTDVIASGYDDINEAAKGVESTTSIASGAISGLGATATTVATGGLALLAAAVAAVAATAVAAVASIGLLAKAAFDLSSEVEASQKNIQAQLGLTEEASEDLAETARDVWANNFAGSIDEATTALIEVRKQLKGISDDELQDATENAIRLSDAFGVDITESTNAANVLMKQFGLSQQEAFDFIAKGFQKGLNTSDDFLDSISEYGNLFGQAGGDAGEFFSLMETGLQGGVLGTDKAADAFKEFHIRFMERNEDLLLAFDDMGVAVNDVYEQVEDGSLTTIDIFKDVVWSLNQVEDPLLRNAWGIGTMGTQFEDLGTEAVAAIDVTKTSLEDLLGATNNLNEQYNTLPQVFEGVKRKLLVAIQPIGDALLNAANEVMPMLLDAIDDLKPALEDFAVILGDAITKAVKDFIPWVQKKLIPALVRFWKFLNKNVIPILEDLWDLFKESQKRSKEVQKSFKKMQDVIEPFVKKTMTNLLEIWEIIKKWVDKNWPLIQKTIVVVMTKIKTSVDRTTKAIKKIWDKWGDEIMATVEFVFDTVWKVVKTSVENVLDIISAVMKIITGDWKGAWEDIVKILKRQTKLITDIVNSVFMGLVNIAARAIQDMINAITSKVSQLTNALISTVASAVSALLSSISSGAISNILKSIGQNIINGIINGAKAVTNFVSSLLGSLASWLSNIASQVSGGFLGTIIRNIGTQIVNTIISGINAFTAFVSAVKAQITSWVVSIVNSLGTIATAAWLMGRKIIDNLLSGIGSMAGQFKAWIKDKVEEWLGDVFSPIPMAQHVGEEIMANIQLGMFAQKGPFIGGLRASLVDWIAQSGAGLSGNFAIPATVSGPSLGAGGATSISNTFNLGNNNIASSMDAATFEARVLQVIRKNL